ncbi:hypothetical protein AGDE_00726 [Angomonas deanei]|nr:hypothetical protein AGDE_00726 [Angomonas deanei]|eukprot:EPY43196.1 hypothetical protein AGDE_00726 [Angomonas deanei]
MSTAAEAESLIAAAKKHLKKPLFGKPNYNSAAEEYEQAAKFYTSEARRSENNQSFLESAKECWTASSAAHEKAKNGIFAARAMVALGELYHEDGVTNNRVSSFQQAGTTFEKASQLYALEIKTDKQAECLGKASAAWREVLKRAGEDAALKKEAKQKTDELTEETLNTMQLSWEVDEKRPYKLPEQYRAFITQTLKDYQQTISSKEGDGIAELRTAVMAEKRMLGINTKTNQYDDSKNIFTTLKQPSNAAKCGLEIIILCLSSSKNASDAVIWADEEMNILRSVTGFAGSKEERAAGNLLSAYEDNDIERLQMALKESHEINFLAPDIARMGKKLTFAGGKVERLNVNNMSSNNNNKAVDEFGSDEDIR